jgi:hypothetical protein
MQHQEHKYCKKHHPQNSKALKQSNQSHPPSSVQVTSQHSCHFIATQNLFINEGSLFCFVLYIEVSQSMASFHMLGIFGKLLMSRGASTWIESVWSYSVEAIGY